MAVGDDEVIDEAVVKIRPDLEGFGRQLQAKVDAAAAKIKAKIELVADRKGFGASIKDKVAEQQALSNNPTLKIGLRAVRDRAFTDSIKTEVAKQNALSNPTIKVGLSVDGKGLSKGVRGATRKGRGLADGDVSEDIEEGLRKIKTKFQDVEDSYLVIATDIDRTLSQQLRNGTSKRAGFLIPRSASQSIADQYKRVQDNNALVNAANKRAEEQQAADHEAATRRKQRSDEQYAAFRSKIYDELAKIEADRKNDEINNFHDTERAHERIAREGSRLRISLLAAEEKIENEARQRTERAERASNSRRARSNRSLVSSALGGKSKLIDFGGQGIRPANLLKGALVALSPLLIAVASSAAQASFSIAAVGTASIGAAVAVTGLVIGFQGVLAALKERQTVQKQTLAQSANADAKAAKATKAATASDAAALDAKDALLDAQEALKRSQRDELAAQLDINDARKDAVRDLENLRQAVRDLQNQERSDRLSVAESKDKAAEVGRNFFSSSLEKARANQDVRDSETRLSDTKLERKQKKTDLAESLTKGIEGSDTVKNAKQAAKDATEARKRDQRQLANAKRDQAAAKLNQATADTGTDSVTSSASDLEQKLKDMSPAARDMYNWFVDNEQVLKKLQRRIEQGVLPGFTQFLREVNKGAGKEKGTSSLEIFADAAGLLGGKLGILAAGLGRLTRQKWFRKEFSTIIDANSTAMDNFIKAAYVLVKPLLKIFSAASPLLVRFSGYVVDLSEKFSNFIDDAEKTGKLNKFFQDAGDELSRWWDLAKSIGNFLVELFGAAEPSGGTVVTRLTTFFNDSADWVKKNKPEIKKFFDKLADLPYADIIKTVTTMTGLFLTWHAIKWTAANTPLALMLALAATNPEETNKLFEAIRKAVDGPLKWIADHPKSVEVLTALLLAYKGAKATGLLKIAFPGLSKMFGSTGTMTVQAAVVNVYGGAGVPGGVGGLGGKAAPVAGFLAGASAGSVTALLAAAIAGAFEANLGVTGGQNGEGYFDPLKKAVADPSFGNIMGAVFSATPVYSIAYAIGAAQRYEQNRMDTGTARDQESKAFDELQRTVTRDLLHGTNELGLKDDNDVSANSNPILQAYIDKRRGSVQAAVEQERATKGEIAAQTLLNIENQKSVDTLSNLLQITGWSKTKADAYAAAVYGVHKKTQAVIPSIDNTAEAILNAGQQSYEASVKANNLRDTLGKLGIKSDGVKTQVDNLKLSLDNVVGDKKVTLSVNGEEKVFKSLSEALTYQYALNTGSSLKDAASWIDSQKRAKQRQDQTHDTIGAATGGYILGPGTATSDSIPARLSRGEYVHREKAVRHYGPEAMHAINNMQVPRENLYAAGGMVGSTFPIKVDMSKTLIPSVMMPGSTPFAGDLAVAETAERVARAMHATEKQLTALMEAGLVESEMRNLTHGDQDSVGFLQQRPSQGWGTVKQLLNPEYATRKFINAAKRIAGQDQLSAGQLAQAVQRSKYPDRYAAREADAIGVLNMQAPFLKGYSALGGGGGSAPGTWQGLWQLIQTQFPGASLFSGFRNSRTLSGNVSRHALGKAIDVSPWRSIADYIWNNFGSSTYELITPFVDRMIYKGKFHKYSRAIEAQHGVYGDNAHVHWSSYAQGGEVPVRTYDSGGGLPPGYTLAYNGTGHTETIRTHHQEKQLATGGGTVRLDRRDLHELARIIAAATPAVNMDGRKVAEVTNRYTYLPAGV